MHYVTDMHYIASSILYYCMTINLLTPNDFTCQVMSLLTACTWELYWLHLSSDVKWCQCWHGSCMLLLRWVGWVWGCTGSDSTVSISAFRNARKYAKISG